MLLPLERWHFRRFRLDLGIYFGQGAWSAQLSKLEQDRVA